MNSSFCDVLIVGAGIIGSSLAVRLAQCGIKVIIIDHQHFFPIINSTVPNVRVSAINYASMEFFKKINVWKNIPSEFLTPYHHMKTWEYTSAMVTFDTTSIKVPEMGYIIENNRLKLALWNNIIHSELITFFYSSTLISLKHNGTFWKCILDKNIIINSKLLIGADGYNSKIRKKMRIDIITWKHHQCCMLLTIKTEKNTYGTIWQMFTPNGPIGFLPLYDNWGTLMWFDSPERINKLKYLPKLKLEKKIENNFYKELGKVILHNIASISLKNQRAHKYIGLNAALIGDAAHTLHPLAGQGINLGIRDVIKLSELLINSDVLNTHIPVLEDILLSYQIDRQRDIYFMQSSINWLYFIFHNNILPLKIARNFAFMTIENISCIKKRLLKYAVLGI